MCCSVFVFVFVFFVVVVVFFFCCCFVCFFVFFFFFQAEDGLRDFCLSRGLGDVCKRQVQEILSQHLPRILRDRRCGHDRRRRLPRLLHTSDAADDLLCVDFGGRRIIKKKNNRNQHTTPQHTQITKPILNIAHAPRQQQRTHITNYKQ